MILELGLAISQDHIVGNPSVVVDRTSKSFDGYNVR